MRPLSSASARSDTPHLARAAVHLDALARARRRTLDAHAGDAGAPGEHREVRQRAPPREQQRRDARARQRRVRQQAAAAARVERDRRRAETLAARQAASNAVLAERNRTTAEKARRRRTKERDKSVRRRQRARAAMWARVKQGAHRWLSRMRPGGQPT